MILPVILSGGTGTRLWPVSRKVHPKPFMLLADGETLIEKTYQRVSRIQDVKDIVTITNRDYYFLSLDEFAKIKKQTPSVTDKYLLEPCGRNTAPAIAMAALMAANDYGKDTVLLVLPSDHLISDASAFIKAVELAVAAAKSGNLVTFGIKPDQIETGYGYIEMAEPDADHVAVRNVKQFIEKPDYEHAKQYVESGNYVWNSGMFCFQAGVMLSALEQHAADIYENAIKCWEASVKSDGSQNTYVELEHDCFVQFNDISIDYAVMEQAENVKVIPADIGWNDIGSWNAVSSLIEPDADDNRISGNAIMVDSKNNYVKSEHRLTALVGVHNLVVVDTPDALLIADKSKTQDVKKAVEKLKQEGHECLHMHVTVPRPWGTYTVLEAGQHFKIKRIVVKSGSSLSLQMHHHRSEHWVVVSGTAKITNGEEVKLIYKNESTFIPAGQHHRLENPGVIELVMIEVQSGEYLGEDDIVRFEDKYNRIRN